jgi:hypothetical protein
MANYLALLPDPTMQSRLWEAVGDGPGRRERVGLHFCASGDELRERARTLLPAVVVFDPHDRRTLGAASCGRFAAEFPTVVLFAYADFGGTPWLSGVIGSWRRARSTSPELSSTACR